MPATAVVVAGCHRPTIWSAAVAVRNRLYPAAAQVGVLWRHCEDARLVWNLAVEQQSWWWPGRGGAPGSAERQRQLAQARAAEPWLAEGSSAVQQQALGRRAGGGPAGIDRGVRTALVTSGGQHYRAPQISGRRAARYLALEQRLRRQSRGSRRRERTRQAMAQITAHVTDRRRDWAEKVSTRLVIDHDVIVLEKLNIAGMVRKPKAKPDPEQRGGFLAN